MPLRRTQPLKTVKDENPRPKQNPWLYASIPLALLLVRFVTWPLRDLALVFWVRGGSAYQEGVRVLRGKPIRFSDGALAPDIPDLVTGFAAFLVAIVVAVTVTLLVIRWSEQRPSQSNSHHA